MFGVNYAGSPQLAQGPLGLADTILKLFRATTQFIAGFKRTTKKVL